MIRGEQALLLTGLLTLGSAAYASWREAGPYLHRGAEEAETISRIEARELVPALSQQSHQDVAEDCLKTVSSLYFKTRPTAQRRAFAESCRELLRGSVASMPSFSFGWYVLAALEPVSGDFGALNTELRNSQATGSAEQWIAELRVALAEDYLDRLSEEVLTGERRDLEMLVRSQRGVNAIARRYVDDPGFRERITAIVEQMLPDAQAQFVAHVRLAAGQS